MTAFDLDNLSWSRERVGEGVSTLARASGLSQRSDLPPHASDSVDLRSWVEVVARWVGVEAVALDVPHPELSRFVRTSAPSMVGLPDGDEMRFLLILSQSRRHVRLLAPDGRLHRVPEKALRERMSRSIDARAALEVEKLLGSLTLPASKRARVREHMISERLSEETLTNLWMLRARPGVSGTEELRRSGLGRMVGVFVSAYAVDYLLWVVSWWVIGRGALRGQMDWGWLAAWALLFVTRFPFRVLATWFEGKIAVAAGSLLKRRLLLGAMRLEPDETREDGVGRHVARVLESQAVESLALGGGLLSLAATVELLVAGVVLGLGAGGWLHASLLGLTLVLFAAFAWRYVRVRSGWTDTRLRMSHDLVERMVGHRTRLVQQRPEAWHEGEDVLLEAYLGQSRAVDRASCRLQILPRLWLPLSLLGIAVPFIAGTARLGPLAAALGGMLLAFRGLHKLVNGLPDLVDASIAWRNVAPLVDAAAREPRTGDPHALALVASAPAKSADTSTVLEGAEIQFRYPRRSEPVLQTASFRVASGDRVLLTSPSGGGKSTLVSIMNGLRAPDSGMLLLRGVDRPSLGAEGWTRRIATAPQFHENYVFTESFAFNALMGRAWPPRPGDWQEAEALCRQLGLGELLDRMPGGMNQLVGETGWQLSHGEKSRLFLARALLQGSDLVLLDESFAALDPVNLKLALSCARRTAPSLLVVAHP